MQGSYAFDELLKHNGQFSPDAFEFVLEALNFTIARAGERRHVTGQELLCGVRDLALDSWGLMARHVLEVWGIRSTDNIGDIVFALVGAGVLSKTEQDKIDDFRGVFAFPQALDEAYKPEFDEHGRVRRKWASRERPELPAWSELFDAQQLN